MMSFQSRETIFSIRCSPINGFEIEKLAVYLPQVAFTSIPPYLNGLNKDFSDGYFAVLLQTSDVIIQTFPFVLVSNRSG